MAEFREEGASSGLLESSTAAAVPAGNIRDVSDELTQFAPFEASKTISLSYRGDPSKPPQVEINDASYLGQPKVLFRKLREGNPSRPGGGGPAGIRDPELRGSAGGGAAGKNRVRVQVVGSGWHEEREGGAGGRRGGGKVVDPESGRVTKSLVLNRIGTLGKDQDSRHDLKRYWMPDSACKECSECGTKFNIIVRRHHCRICGRIFCNACCSLTIPATKLRPDLQGNLRVCKECLEIFQEFQTIKRPEGSGLTSDPTSANSKPAPTSASSSSSSPSSAAAPASSSGVAAKMRSVSSSFQKNVAVAGEGGGSGAGVGGSGGGGGGSGGGGEAGPIRRTGSGNHARAVTRQSMATVLSPHMSWDDASLGRSQDDPPSGLARMDIGFDNPTSLRPKESFESLHERDERLMALNEDEVEYVITEVWFQLISPGNGISPQNHRYRLRTFPNTFSAAGIIAWLLRTGHASNRVGAVAMGQALVDTKRLQVVSSLDNQFKDEQNLFLEFGQAAHMGSEQLVESPTDLDAPTWFQRLPENGDSEAEQSQRASLDRLSVRYNRGRGSFMNSLQPTITISSMSELTGVADSESVLPQEKEHYFVVNQDKLPVQQSCGSSGSELKLSLHGEEHSMSPGPSTPPPSLLPMAFDPTSPNYNNSFTVVSDRDIMKALPVGGLSAAADTAQDLEFENGKDVKTNDEARVVLEKERTLHFDSIMIQLIKSCGISLSWLKVIKPLIKEAVRKVKTNVYSTDTMDITQYVKVKKIPGGRRADSILVNGVVCTKNITHKKMKISIRNPTILLLKCAFEFQRKENQLSSFDTLQMQEEKYLKNLVARVKTFQPRVILVQKSVARIALEMFFHLDIVVAVNVKPSVMERVARSTQGDLLHSLDQLFFNVHLGTCGHFHVRDFVLPERVKKTLMYFNNCDPRLGCTITLMGGSRRELKKVKKATLFGVFVAYNSQLETSFLIDEFAWPTAAAAHDNLHLLPDTEEYSSASSTPEWPLHPSVSYPVEGISPAELTRKLEALVPEYKAECEPRESSLRSTPSLPRSSVGSLSSNASPLLSNARSNSVSGTRSESLTVVATETVHDEDSETTLNPAPSIFHSVDNVRSRSDPHLPPIPFVPDSATLSVLGNKEFEKALSLQILSISPGVKFPVPYLQTPQGFAADVRNYLPAVIYWSYQFQAAVQASLKKNAPLNSTENLEMGITAKTVSEAVSGSEPQPPFPQQVSPVETSTQSSRSYRSISEHPFTTSIFLLKANTNEMKAALADYRANSGVTNPSHEFFFPTASRASDYRQHLQNIFNKYQQFELSSSRGRGGEAKEVAGGREKSCESIDGDTKAHDLDGESLASSEEAGEKKQRLRRRTRRHKTPSFTGSGPREGSVVREGSAIRGGSGVREGSEGSKAREGSGLSCDSGVGRASEVMMLTSSEAKDQQEEKEAERLLAGVQESSGKHNEGRGATPLRIMGTLDDIDRDYSKLVQQAPEDELLDLHGNEEKATPLPVHSDHLVTLFPPYQVDCMDPMNHQSIPILFSSTCHDGQRHQLPCVPPCVIQMQYYGHNDISLGDFLKRYCFRPDYRCQTCSSEMTRHQRHIIHGTAALHISVQHLDITIPRSNDGIFTWLACKHCTLCTPYIRMADNSLLFSFAKFLELKFHCDQFVTRLHSKTDDASCQHGLHPHYLHYFSFRNKIACFQPAEISILELRIPPTVVVINTPHSEYHHSFSKEIKHIEHITEGVCYRIKQRLQSYNMEPVAALVKESIASSKGERDAFRGRIKLLKEKVVQGGFLESGGEEMSDEKQEAEFAALQDGIAEIKRALTEFVSCWNIELESLDSKIRVFHSRKEAGISRPTSDRDSPFTPMAAEIPVSRGATPRLLPRPDHEDNLLLNTPLSSPPDSSIEDSKVPGPSLNREAGDVAPVTLADPAVTDPGLTPDSQTEVGEEVKASGDTLSTPGSSSRCPYDKNFSSNSDRIISSTEDMSTFDSRISSNSLSGEGRGGGEMEKEMSDAVTPAKLTTAAVAQANDTKTGPKGCEKSVGVARGGSDHREASTGHPSCGRGKYGPNRAPSSEPQVPVSTHREPTKTDAEFDRDAVKGSEDSPMERRMDERGSHGTNVTPTIVVSEDELGDGEGEGWWSDRGSPLSAVGGSDSPFRSDTATDSEGKGGYQSVRTLVVSGPGQKSAPPPLGEESQPDGVGLFNRFRVTKDTEVRDDPTKFYLVDPADISSATATPPHRTPELPQSHHHGHHHGSRPHRRQGNPPGRKNGSSSAPPTPDTDGRASRGMREKERGVPIRPFQKLPPPFDLNEHHNMHRSLKIPIAIYEKEPTSLIAYALSSREYAQEYWALVERRPVIIQPTERLLSRPSSPKVPKKQVDPPLVQLPPPTKTSALKQAYQELRKKGPLNAMNVFSGLSVASDRPEPHDRSGDESRRIEAALSSKSSHSSSSTPSKSSQTNSSSFPATDQSALQEDGEGFRWNATGEHASTGSSSKGGHISLEFTAPDRTSSIFCKVYFAEEFQHIRELVFPSGEDRFIRSLSRCVKFDAKGGKSRSTFCKVIDDRFIMKQIKTVEISSFEQIAPLYFDHITSALESKRPLALAKILGVYTIGYRNTRTGNSKRLDVIVMENLLYGMKSSKVFDLKGSMRSRYIDPSKDSSNDVLLDENFLNHICYSPVYVYPHSKAVLMRAIDEDTRFLAENAIMDYSLLTCIDDQTGELVVGIIDYVRTFTLDKRLEMYIKKTAGRVLPTVVYPELYRKRFCEAIDRYFTIVPDKWTGLGTGF